MKKYKVLLFYNAFAGNGMFANSLDTIIARFQKNGMMIIPVRADQNGTIESVLKRINPKEYRKIIVAGGDGTINILVNAMINNDIHLPIALFPAGTANDLAYYFDIPTTIDEMIEIALNENYTCCDVGQENCKYFINVAALGFLVDVSQKTDPAIKNTLGIMSYYLRGMREIPNLKPFNVRITSDEYTAEEKIYFMLAMNGRSAGGFRRLSPKAVINDGLLDIMLFKEMPIRDIAPLLFNIVAGHHQENKNVIFFRTKKVHIEADQAIGSDVDGEKGCDLPLTIKVLEKRLMINTKYSDMEGTIW